jgi:hypothetical protein
VHGSSQKSSFQDYLSSGIGVEQGCLNIWMALIHKNAEMKHQDLISNVKICERF